MGTGFVFATKINMALALFCRLSRHSSVRSERLPVKQLVIGPNPIGGANFYNISAELTVISIDSVATFTVPVRVSFILGIWTDAGLNSKGK